MPNPLAEFERIVRAVTRFTEGRTQPSEEVHPFDSRDIHPQLPHDVRDLFDDGYYAQASFEAFKFVDKEIQRLAAESESGYKLMMRVFDESSPIIQLAPCQTQSEKDEQKGYRFLFAGAVLAIRNPRGHDPSVKDDPDTCLDHLSLASLLLRRLEKSGYKIK
jgi:uncharacterized protein (TIGR02391 family)